MKKIYCNPISLPDIPKGTDEELLGIRDSERDYCSVSDPDGIYVNGTYYVYTSYKAAYSSKNLIDWSYHRLEGIKEDTYYGPAIMEIDNRFYFTAGNSRLYVSDTPIGPFEELGYFKNTKGEEILLEDPDLFVDDDDRVYIYWGCGVDVGIVGAELDRDNPVQMITEPVQIIRFNSEHIWERWGEYNQDSTVGWIEGNCMVKVGKRYYLNYAACGTTFGKYATGVYYSDESPLSGFVYQKNNPVMNKPSGLVRGGGHSCVIKKDDNELWGFYTCPVSYSHRFERLIGMDRVRVSEGELYMNVTDIPCTMDGKTDDTLLPLTFYSLVNVTSNMPGRDAVFAVDDNILSFWQPAEDDKNPMLTVSLRGEYDVSAVRILRRPLGLDFENKKEPSPLCYRVEVKNICGEWENLIDCMNNEENKLYDFRQTPTITATDARLVLKQECCDVKNGIISFVVFGKHK